MEAVSFNGGKTVTTYSYFPLTGRLSTLNAYTVPGGVNIIYKLYDYNKSGDITGLHDLKNSIDYAYAYDPLHRLISEQSSGGGASTATTVEVIDFTYTQEPGKPVHAPTETKLNNASTQYTYTATGTRLSKQGGLNTTLYEVNDDNQIKKITEGGVVTSFFYDADGKRIRKTQGASSTLYFGKDLEIINHAPTLYAFAGNLRIARMTGAATEYYHKDHQGSTNAISNENGTVVDTAEYLPYGPDRSANALLNHSAYKYTDQEQDAGTGLYNYDARLYDPVLGQFVMADTIVPDPFNPQALNRYAYCLNNPVRYVDPDGHSYDSFGPGGKVDFGESASNFGTSEYDAQASNDGWAEHNNTQDLISRGALNDVLKEEKERQQKIKEQNRIERLRQDCLQQQKWEYEQWQNRQMGYYDQPLPTSWPNMNQWTQEQREAFKKNSFNYMVVGGSGLVAGFFAPEIVALTVTIVSTPDGRQKVIEFANGYLDYTSAPTKYTEFFGALTSLFGPDPKKY